MSEPAAGRPGILARINFNTVLACACIGFSVLLFLTIPYQVERPPVLFGQSASSLDPAFFPSLVAVCFLLVGVWYLRVSFGLREQNGFSSLSGQSYGRVAVTVVAFIIYASILRPFGFLLSSALIVAALSVFYGARHVPSILLVAFGVPAAVYFIFRRALSVSLPEFPDL